MANDGDHEPVSELKSTRDMQRAIVSLYGRTGSDRLVL